MSNWFKIKNSLNANEADIEIYDEIGGWGVSASDFIQQLKELAGKHLNVRINSIGGSIIDGTAIITALKRHSGGFTTWVDGLAASMASVIACSAEKCNIADGALMMIHRAATVSMGDAEDLRKDADVLEVFEKGIINTYVKKTGLEEKDILKMLDEETWMDALTAVALGFCDAISEGTPATASVNKEVARAKFDKFKNSMSNATQIKNEETKVEETKVETPVKVEETKVETPVKVEETKVEKTDEEKKKEEEALKEVKKDNPLIVDAKAIIAKVEDLKAKYEASEKAREEAETKLKEITSQLKNLESSVGVSAATVEAKIEIVNNDTNKVLSKSDFDKLSPINKQLFFRNGGKRKD